MAIDIGDCEIAFEKLEMPIVVDARGLSCPMPRQMAIEAIRSTREGDTIIVLVDREDARDSVVRVVKALRLPYRVQKNADRFEIHISRVKLWLEG